MHNVQDIWSCEYTQLPCAFTRTWATTQVKRVDMLYLGAYTEGGRYFGWVLLRAFTVLHRICFEYEEKGCRHEIELDTTVQTAHSCVASILVPFSRCKHISLIRANLHANNLSCQLCFHLWFFFCAEDVFRIQVLPYHGLLDYVSM